MASVHLRQQRKREIYWTYTENFLRVRLLLTMWEGIIINNSDRCSTGNGFKIVKVIAEIDTAVRIDTTVRQLGQFGTL